jgi:hypothetical protein
VSTHPKGASGASHAPHTTLEILEQSNRKLCAVTGQIALMIASGRGLTRRGVAQMIEDLVAAQLLLRRLEGKSE